MTSPAQKICEADLWRDDVIPCTMEDTENTEEIILNQDPAKNKF